MSGADGKTLQCYLANLVMWFVARRTISVEKVHFLKIEIVSLPTSLIYYI
jgi:hypothetical protein